MKYLNITDKTTIYIVAPAKIATGGPELLHQLAYLLRNELKLKAFMYYQPLSENPVHSNYIEYDVPFVNKIDDCETNILIVPELYEYIKLFKNYNNIQKVLWWLSVDFFYSSKFDSENKIKSFLFRLNNFISSKTGLLSLIDIASYAIKYYEKYNLTHDPFINSVNLHCVQSEYARANLEKSRIKNIVKLSDYLNEDFIKIATDNDKKENIVAYNPKKGAIFTNALKAAASGINFIPIENMNRKEVIELLQKSKVYIDFGNHPGKDRIPREAAILNCVILTGKRGSAKYKQDVAIDEEFKFDETERDIKMILKKIIAIFNNFEQESKKFDLYREKIKKEKDIFLLECQTIFARK